MISICTIDHRLVVVDGFRIRLYNVVTTAQRMDILYSVLYSINFRFDKMFLLGPMNHHVIYLIPVSYEIVGIRLQ
jgi:hypothetical protein